MPLTAALFVSAFTSRTVRLGIYSLLLLPALATASDTGNQLGGHQDQLQGYSVTERKPIVVYDIDKILAAANNKHKQGGDLSTINNSIRATIYHYTSLGYVVVELHPGKSPPPGAEKDITQEMADAAGLDLDSGGIVTNTAGIESSNSDGNTVKLACMVTRSSTALTGTLAGKSTQASPPYTILVTADYDAHWVRLDNGFVKYPASITEQTIDFKTGEARLGGIMTISIDRISGIYHSSKEENDGGTIWQVNENGKCTAAHQQF